jgi:hypothetical protein
MQVRMLDAESQKRILIVDRDIAIVEPLREQLGHAGSHRA